MESALEIQELTVTFHTNATIVVALDRVTFSVRKGETLAVIGESGSGKSVLGQAIMGILPGTARVRGSIMLGKTELVQAYRDGLDTVRGKVIGWVPQNPKKALNPSMKIWKQIAEIITLHSHDNWSEARKKAVSLLDLYHVSPAGRWAEEYPVSYSGGMLQRAVVAMATSVSPEILIADEPTKGVDPINKASIVETFSGLKEREITQIVITHDLDFAAELADRVVVLYGGQVVEITGTHAFFSHPHHPYSQALLGSLPENGLSPIPGLAPSLGVHHTGCRFRERCGSCTHECGGDVPFISIHDDYVRCLPDHIGERAV